MSDRKRSWMQIEFPRSESSAQAQEAQTISLNDAEALAHLMLTAYAGTVDEEEESYEQCLKEAQETILGKYGPMLESASFISYEGAHATAASVVTYWKEFPLLAFSMTAPSHQRRGLGGALIEKSMKALEAEGYPSLHLVVTDGNTAAENLYKKLGFTRIGPALPQKKPDGSL